VTSCHHQTPRPATADPAHSHATGPEWTLCGPHDAELLGSLNAQLAEDEGTPAIGPPSAYTERMRGWLEHGRYQAAIARRGNDVMAYVLWRDDPDYGDIFIRQYFVSRQHRGTGLGHKLLEHATHQFWHGKPLRLDVYDTNPQGRKFWEKAGFTPYSRLMRRRPLSPL
jgi:GNAT superfamily N-acetyltransferase